MVRKSKAKPYETKQNKTRLKKTKQYMYVDTADILRNVSWDDTYLHGTTYQV